MSSNRSLVIQAGIVVLLLGGLAVHYTKLKYEFQRFKAETDRAEQQVAQYEKAVGSANKYKGLEEILVHRMKITDRIARRPNPQVFMALKDRDPSLIWLSELKAEAGKVHLKGQAIGQDELKLLMAGLCSPKLRHEEQKPDGLVAFEVEMPDECYSAEE